MESFVALVAVWGLVAMSGAPLIGRAITLSQARDPLDEEYRELIIRSR